MASIRPAALLLSLVVALAAALPTPAAGTGEAKRVVLRDGSVIVATVEGPTNGVYTLVSPEVGTLRLPYYRVKRVEPLPASETPRPAGVSGDAVRELQRRMATDPKTAARVSKLQGSPSMQSVLQDPEILQAITRGDLGALEKNPKIEQLMRDPALKALFDEMQGAPPAATPTPPAEKSQ